jgi:hypothetical protein
MVGDLLSAVASPAPNVYLQALRSRRVPAGFGEAAQDIGGEVVHLRRPRRMIGLQDKCCTPKRHRLNVGGHRGADQFLPMGEHRSHDVTVSQPNPFCHAAQGFG